MSREIIPLPLDMNLADEFLPRKPSWAKSDQTTTDAVALITMARAARPRVMLEIGTSAGEGAAAILFATESFGSKLYTIDFAKNVYYEKSKVIGAVIDESFPQYLPRYFRKTGAICDTVRTLGERFDFVHIDGAHSHPWATIDFLNVLPYLNPGALVAFHDANYTAAVSQAGYYIARLLPGQFVGNHFLYKFEGDTLKLFRRLMSSLELNWQTSVEPKVLEGLAEQLATVFSREQAEALARRATWKNASYLKFKKLYTEINGSLWKRELEYRRLLAAAEKQE